MSDLNRSKQLLLDARAMIPALLERQGEAASLASLPDATIAEMQRSGFFKIMQPARYGGYELPPQQFFDVQQTLAEGCMSTAWVLGVVAIHNWQLGMFNDRAQQDVWGEDDSTLISSSYMPVGKVKRVDGGYMLSGHWGFSSGSKHCKWAFLGGMVPPATDGEAPDYRTFLVPLGDYDIVDNWDVSGLQGTGSNDIVIKEPVFVPEYRTHRSADGFSGDNPGCKENTNSIFRFPFGQIFTRAVACSSIGALQGVVDSYVEVNRNRVGLNDGARAATDPNVQMALANAVSVITECRVMLKDDLAYFVNTAEAGDSPAIEQRIQRRFHAANISRKCADAVNELFIACGAQGIFRGHPLNRAWLDINAGRQHVANNPFKFGRNLGATMLGQPNTDFFL